MRLCFAFRMSRIGMILVIAAAACAIGFPRVVAFTSVMSFTGSKPLVDWSNRFVSTLPDAVLIAGATVARSVITGLPSETKSCRFFCMPGATVAKSVVIGLP